MIEERLQGIHRASDFMEQVQADYEVGIEPGLAANWPLDEFYNVKKRQFTAVTGIPSDGKSTFVDNLIVLLAIAHGWRFLICSPENQPIQRHIESLIEIHSGKKFCHPDTIDSRPERALTVDELGESSTFVDQHFRFICPDDIDFDIEFILDLAGKVKHDENDPFDFDGFVLDPYNELEHKRPAGFTETEYISQILSKFRRFAIAENCHSWIVAHPVKLTEIKPKTEEDLKAMKQYAMPSLYDIAGSAHWRNKADMGIVVYRNRNQKPEKTTISVQKVRFRECGSLGEIDFFYDFLCNRYVDNEADLLFNRGRK